MAIAFDESCIFCKIVKKQASSSIIYEDESVMAFLDIRPLNLGHTLVVPKPHFVDIFNIPENELCNIHGVSKLISPAIKKATKADGISIIQQNGKSAGQDIFHFHVHVVPRFEGQRMPSFSELRPVERVKLDEMAKKIRQHL
ncbi:MAG: HIT family protein [Candidatus Bathyarchaeia archaeon]|jgi:diadenosine tetraphosphate (Ap4A) HIT family hydrolase